MKHARRTTPDTRHDARARADHAERRAQRLAVRALRERIAYTGPRVDVRPLARMTTADVLSLIDDTADDVTGHGRMILSR